MLEALFTAAIVTSILVRSSLRYNKAILMHRRNLYSGAVPESPRPVIMMNFLYAQAISLGTSQKSADPVSWVARVHATY